MIILQAAIRKVRLKCQQENDNGELDNTEEDNRVKDNGEVDNWKEDISTHLIVLASPY